MTHTPPPEHFRGKNVADHLKEARQKGAYARVEMHGSELPGHRAAAAESAKEVSVGALLLWAVQAPPVLILLFVLGWTLWKTGRSAVSGWAKLERLHRVIEEERWEIEHHRDQEKEELRELYREKGFQGKLLEEAVEVMMADDNRLLKVMLEEEMGLTLEAYEHPLKQALGSFWGAACSSLVLCGSLLLFPKWGIPAAAAIVISTSAFLSAQFERRHRLPALVWNLSLAFFCAASLYFIHRLL